MNISYLSIAAVVMIAAGAVVMALGLRMSRRVSWLFSEISAADRKKVKRQVGIQEALMLLFLPGYAAVALAILFQVPLMGDLFVGIIFLMGAAFVLLSMLVSSRMLALIRKRYEDALSTGIRLEVEQARLLTVNEKLEQEIVEREAVEAALQQSGAFLQDLIDALPEQVLVIGVDYRVSHANRAALRAGGCGDHVAGRSCHEISHGQATPCSGEEHPCPLIEAQRKRRTVTMEHVHRHGDGGERVVEIMAAPVFDADGKVIQIIESGRDITERRRAEAGLRESEKRYRTILDSIEEGYFEIDRAGSFTFFNTSMCALVGRPPEKMNGLNFRDYTTPETAERVFGVFNEAYRTGVPSLLIQYEIVTADGNKTVEVSASLMVAAEGEPYGFRGVARDVTKILHAGKALEESEDRYRRFSEVSLEGICFHCDGRILDANDAFFDMFGYARVELIDTDSIDIIIAPEDRERVRQQITAAVTSPYEANGQKRDGTCFPIEIEGRNTRYEGEPARVSAIRDITLRKRTEEKMSQIQKMEALGTLAGGIAHDFNNILSAIMGYTELSLLDTGGNVQQAEKLEHVLQASRRAKELVGQILAFTRQGEETLKPVSLRQIAEEALKLLRASIPSTIAFAVDLERGAGVVVADPTQIHRVIMNLCTNASQAMEEKGGLLDVRMGTVSVDRQAVRRNADLAEGEYIRLTVKDDGHGMDRETLTHIYEPYFTTKKSELGTGLGLSAVHGIVRRCGGAIEVDSRPGDGTTFRIYFPKADADYLGPAIREPVSVPGMERVLLVDDDELVTRITGEMLQHLGYSVVLKESAQEALDLFRKYPSVFDLVITDMTMPGMKGDQLAKAIRSVQPTIPIIICTGMSRNIPPEKAREMGIDGFLRKPVEMKELSQMVRAVLD